MKIKVSQIWTQSSYIIYNGRIHQAKGICIYADVNIDPQRNLYKALINITCISNLQDIKPNFHEALAISKTHY